MFFSELSPGGGGSGSGSGGGGGNGPARSRDRNERGETAMHVAAIKGDQDGIKKLLEQGMSPNVADFAGKKLYIPNDSHTYFALKYETNIKFDLYYSIRMDSVARGLQSWSLQCCTHSS